jgi:RNA polymerase sigma-70 factor (ECF subfamily)
MQIRVWFLPREVKDGAIMPAMTLTDEAWTAALAPPPAEPAVAELRDLLLRNLSRAFAGRPGVRGADLEDFAQEATMRVIERLPSFRAESRFSTWATSVAVRVALGHLRRGAWATLPFPEGGAQEPVQRARLEADVYEAALQAALTRAIGALTPRQRAVIEAELAGVDRDELAARLGTNRNALYKLAHDARAKLRAALLGAGFSLAEVRDHLRETSDE